MRLYEFGVGKIVKGVNTTPDVGPNEIPNQAKKFGNKVSKNGSPPVNPGGKIYFKEAVEYSWPYDTSAKFKVDGMQYNIEFLPLSNSKKDGYEVEFSAVHGPRFTNSGLMGSSAIQVFGTVISAIEDFIRRENPDILYFTGDKSQNRVDLYSKLLKRREDELADLGYSIDYGSAGNKVEFTIAKNNVSEAVIKLGGKPGGDSPAVKMIEKFNELTGENPLNPKQRVTGNAKAEIYPVGNVTVRLSDIQSLGGGDGTKLLKTICSLADEYGVTIKLMAYGYDNVPTEKLVEWYKRFGFESWSEFEEDDDGVEMVRDSK